MPIKSTLSINLKSREKNGHLEQRIQMNAYLSLELCIKVEFRGLRKLIFLSLSKVTQLVSFFYLNL